MTRIEFMKELAYNLNEADCLSLFGVSRDCMASGYAIWNYDLEYAYNNYISELEEENE